MSRSKHMRLWPKPNRKCIGWHNLTEEQYTEKKAQWEERQAQKKAAKGLGHRFFPVAFFPQDTPMWFFESI